MLKLSTKTPQIFNDSLKHFDLNQQTWVVADLSSKQYVQNILLSRTRCLPEDCVLRMSEWVQKILKIHAPEMELVSTQLMLVLVREWLEKNQPELAQHPGSSPIILQYIGEFLPLITQTHMIQKTREWLKENPEALLRWGFWFEVCVKYWDYCQKQKRLCANWVSAYLASQQQELPNWPRQLVFDLGADMTGPEYELLKIMADKNELTLFAPTQQETMVYSETLWVYKLAHENQVADKTDIAKHFTHESKQKCFKFSTQLAEVKSAVAKCREWLEQGVSLEKICITTSDIETYWDTLKLHCDIEGVPIRKNKVIAANTLPQVQSWLSRLKIESQSFDFADLESSLFHPAAEYNIKYEPFIQMFSNIFSPDDLSRDENVKKIFKQKQTDTNILTRDQFVAWAFEFLPQETLGIDACISQLLLETPVHQNLMLSAWLQYLSALVAKVEVRLEASEDHGIYLLNLNAATEIEFTHTIILGMSEKQFVNSQHVNITPADVKKIANDLGVYLNNPDRDYFDYLVYLRTQQTTNEVYFFYASTDFAGQPQAPCLYWLKQALSQKKNLDFADPPGTTRWDEIQRSLSSGAPNDKDTQVSQQCWNAVQKEIGNAPSSLVTQNESIRFSITQVEKYLSCPFLFTAEKLFHLSDLPNVDLDIDAMTTGRLLHAALERLLQEESGLSTTDQQLDRLLDELSIQMALPIADQQLWRAQKKQYQIMLIEFLKFETEWRKSFPKTQTVGRELPVKGDWTTSQGHVVSFTGRIDRVDQDKTAMDDIREYVLLDYKTSHNGLHNYNSWLTNDELQLLFYSYAVEQGWTSLPKGSVTGAFYFAIKQLKRSKGMLIAERKSELLPHDARARNIVQDEQKSKMYNELKSTVDQVIEKIRDGYLYPNPKDKEDCKQCSWRTLCRAPHLV